MSEFDQNKNNRNTLTDNPSIQLANDLVCTAVEQKSLQPLIDAEGYYAGGYVPSDAEKAAVDDEKTVIQMEAILLRTVLENLDIEDEKEKNWQVFEGYVPDYDVSNQEFRSNLSRIEGELITLGSLIAEEPDSQEDHQEFADDIADSLHRFAGELRASINEAERLNTEIHAKARPIAATNIAQMLRWQRQHADNSKAQSDKRPKRSRNQLSKANEAEKRRKEESLRINPVGVGDWTMFKPDGIDTQFTPQVYEGYEEKGITRHTLHLANSALREAKQSKGDDADILIRFSTPNSNPNTVYFEGMSVPKDLRGKGLGKQALEYFMEDAAEQGLTLGRSEVIRKPLLAKMLKESGWEPIYEKDKNGKNIIIKGELLDDGSGQPDTVPVVRIIEGEEAEKRQRRESKRGDHVFYRVVPRDETPVNFKNVIHFDCRWKPPV